MSPATTRYSGDAYAFLKDVWSLAFYIGNPATLAILASFLPRRGNALPSEGFNGYP
jgi:hypothetical protein